MRIAIMQPYVFPYVGYFQLINAVDVFVFYDDVNFIKRGWINRNQLLVNNEANLFSVPLLKASQNKLINEIELGYDEKWLRQFFKTLEFNYKKAPYFKEIFEFIKNIFDKDFLTIADLSIYSIKEIAKMLEIPCFFEKSSALYGHTKGKDKADRLIEICKLRNADTYINLFRGKELYSKAYFKKQEVELVFIKNKIVQYQQFDSDFVGSLSIIDLLMFNSKEQIQNMLNDYSLV